MNRTAYWTGLIVIWSVPLVFKPEFNKVNVCIYLGVVAIWWILGNLEFTFD